jgi:hypothetical protein
MPATSHFGLLLSFGTLVVLFAVICQEHKAWFLFIFLVSFTSGVLLILAPLSWFESPMRAMGLYDAYDEAWQHPRVAPSLLRRPAASQFAAPAA